MHIKHTFLVVSEEKLLALLMLSWGDHSIWSPTFREARLVTKPLHQDSTDLSSGPDVLRDHT